MPVSCGKNQFMGNGGGGDPDVILRDGLPLRSKILLQPAIRTSNSKIAAYNESARRKLFQFGGVLIRTT